MKDAFEATFVLDLAPEAAWEALTGRTYDDEAGNVHYVLPGFPSLEGLDTPGASCTPIEVAEGRLLRSKKDHHPCQGTEISVQLEPSGAGTRVSVVQSGFGPFLDAMGRDTVLTHGHQIVADLRLFIERGLTVPGTAWGFGLGALTRDTPVGVEIVEVHAGGFAERAGLRAADLLLTLGGIRIHDHPQLWTVQALTDPTRDVEVTWARGREAMAGKATPAG